MISDVPTAKDFFDSGIELFDFAWDTVANLITKFSDAINYGVEEADVSFRAIRRTNKKAPPDTPDPLLD